jgi:hypothetical protein
LERQTSTPSEIQKGLASYSGNIDGAFYLRIAGVPCSGKAPDQLPSAEAYASALPAAGKVYMVPICFQFWGANAGRYYEYSGYSGMLAMWMDAINVTQRAEGRGNDAISDRKLSPNFYYSTGAFHS